VLAADDDHRRCLTGGGRLHPRVAVGFDPHNDRVELAIVAQTPKADTP
jgi:hypothetical protein